jgi:hypothetical protein
MQGLLFLAVFLVKFERILQISLILLTDNPLQSR